MSGLDVTPLVPAGRKVIQSYGGGRFRVAGEVFETSILIWPDQCLAWNAKSVADLDAGALHASLTAAGASGQATEILIIGCGAARGIAVEWMDTGAACRTFNVLLGEDRRAAAAILAVD